MTYKELKDKLRAMIWPFPNEPKSLRDSTDFFFQSGMAEMGQWDQCLRINHVSVFPFCSTYVTCGMTMIELPGFQSCDVKRVYTIIADSWCDKVILDPSNFESVETWIHNLIFNWTPPSGEGLPALQQGIKNANASTDCSLGRARKGYWCIHNKRIYLAPWIQSNEAVVVEWDGWKEDWQDTDVLDDTIWGVHEQATLMAYVKWMSKLNYPEQSGIATPVEVLEKEWTARLADLMHFCEQAIAERPERKRERRMPTQQELDAGKPTATIGDVFYGSPSEGFADTGSSSSSSSSSESSAVALTGNAVPLMTSNTTPSGEVFSNNAIILGVSGTSANAYLVFDHNIAYPYGQAIYDGATSALPGFIGYRFEEIKRIVAYKLYPLSSVINGTPTTRAAPKAWELQASNDGVNYITLDSRTGITGWVADSSMSFIIPTPGYYQWYRLWITEADEAVGSKITLGAPPVTLPGLAEMELLYSI